MKASSTEAASTEEAGLDLDDPYLRRVIRLTDQLIGMPRHLSQHVGGFILTRGKVQVNASTDVMIDALRESMAIEISQELFGTTNEHE